MSSEGAGRHWALATPHTAATEAGADAFAAGGNALDAALAAATTLAVVYPHMCGVGGDLIALIRDPSGAMTAIVSAGASPREANADAIRERSGGEMPLYGPDPITVPGAVAGWAALHDAGARLPWTASFEHARACATDGIPVSPSLAASLAWEPKRLASDPGLAGVFFPGGETFPEGALLRQPALAETLAEIANDGARVLYEGSLAERYAAGLRSLGAPLSPADLSSHSVELTPPLTHEYRDHRVSTAPAPSQGFVLLQALAAIEREGLDPDPLGPDVRSLARIFDAGTAERRRHLADPASMLVEVQDLIAAPAVERVASASRTRGSGDTISLMTADADGWAVSLIQSLYSGFGSGILEPTTGIIAHDRGACFTLEEGHPNVFAPSKRPAHTLMPVMVEREGELAVVTGTMGGEAQPQINAQNLIRHLDMGLDPASALSAPRWSVEERQAWVEAEVPIEVVEILRSDGFKIEVETRHSGSLGHSNLIQVGDDGFSAAADPRSDGSARAGS